MDRDVLSVDQSAPRTTPEHQDHVPVTIGPHRHPTAPVSGVFLLAASEPAPARRGLSGAFSPSCGARGSLVAIVQHPLCPVIRLSLGKRCHLRIKPHLRQANSSPPLAKLFPGTGHAPGARKHYQHQQQPRYTFTHRKSPLAHRKASGGKYRSLAKDTHTPVM